VDPAKNVVVLRVGTGEEAKQYEYRVNPTTRYWGTDRQPLSDGLRYRQFREGTDVWFTMGDGRQVVSELWFYDPAVQPASEEKTIYLEGKIVRVDPEKGMVVVRTGTGDAVKEYEYKVEKTTQYWSQEQQPVATGLRYEGFRVGTPIWYRVGPGDQNRVMSEVRFYNPGRRPLIRPRRP
jgi:hypothetical protein